MMPLIVFLALRLMDLVPLTRVVLAIWRGSR